MDRNLNLQRIRGRSEPWDIIVIGGGATGAGCALDAASRGFDVLLLEQHDFGKGTSSRSTKLIHGGVRYLRQGNISLVRESLKERGLLLQNAPHVVREQAFIIPCYSFFQKVFYGLGIKLYDRLSGRYAIGRSRILSRSQTIDHLPTVTQDGLSGGVLYFDGQFDDARLLIDILRTADKCGAAVLNYSRVTSLIKTSDGRISGVEFTDTESGESYSIQAKAVINASGIFSDSVRRMSDAAADPALTFAQGIHLVLDRKFLPSNSAVMIPKTSDGRVLFCIPWHDHVLVGTTDTPAVSAELEPKALEAEIEFVLETAGAYLSAKPARTDILSVFAGIRPLVRSNVKTKTSALSRGHALLVDPSGLITITGGKWTTYRQMAEDAVNKAIESGGQTDAECRTENVKIEPPEGISSPGMPLHSDLPYTEDDIIRAVSDEMARSVEDVLARRTRALFLNTKAAIELAPIAAEIMAAELGNDQIWINDQIARFTEVAESYLPKTAQ